MSARFLLSNALPAHLRLSSSGQPRRCPSLTHPLAPQSRPNEPISAASLAAPQSEGSLHPALPIAPPAAVQLTPLNQAYRVLQAHALPALKRRAAAIERLGVVANASGENETQLDSRCWVALCWALAELSAQQQAPTFEGGSDDEREREAAEEEETRVLAALLACVKLGVATLHQRSTPALAAALKGLSKARGAEAAGVAAALVAALAQRAATMDALTAVVVTTALKSLPQQSSNIFAALGGVLSRPEAAAALPLRSLQRLALSLTALDWQLPTGALHKVGWQCARRHRALPAASLSSLAWAVARRGGKASEDLLAALAPVMRAVLPGCGMKELSDVARAYAKLPGAAEADKDLFIGIAARAERCVDGAAPQDVARVVGSFDELGIQPEVLLGVVEEWADRKLAALTPQALAFALASFARLGNHSSRLLRTAAACAAGKVAEMGRTELAVTMWAFASLDYDPGHELMAAAATAAQADPTAFADRDLSNVLWALAHLDHPPPPQCLDTIATGLLPIAGRYSGVAAARVLWAYASFDHPPPAALTDALAAAVAREAPVLDAQSLSLSAWALGSLRHRHVGLNRALAAELRRDDARFHAFLPQNLANLAWGLAKAGMDPGDNFLDLLAEESATRLAEFAPHEVMSLCWGFANLRRAPAGLAAAAAVELRERHSEFRAAELGCTLWALGKMIGNVPQRSHEAPHDAEWEAPDQTALGAAAAAALEAANRGLPSKIDSLSGKELAMCVWGVGRLHTACSVSTSRNSSDFESALSPTSLAVLKRAVAQKAQELNSVSLVVTVEGLSWLQVRCSDAAEAALSDAIASRVNQAPAALMPWELSLLAFRLTEIDHLPAARALLHHKAAEAAVAEKKFGPVGAIQLLAAMAATGAFSPAVFAGARRRVNRLAETYILDEAYLVLLHRALHELPAAQAGKIKLSYTWQARMAAAWDKHRGNETI